MAKEIKVSEHGCFIYGTLDSVDFVEAGTLENGNKYDASLKLKFLSKVKFKKKIAGVDKELVKTVSLVVKISSETSELPNLLEKYLLLIGKDMLINYIPADNYTYKVLDESSILEIK